MEAFSSGWVGVDLDGTLAHYDGWDEGKIGPPVRRMVDRVLSWLSDGLEVRIFTARVGNLNDPEETKKVVEAIQRWCLEHIGVKLPVTATKDYSMLALWDDRSTQVIKNTGRSLIEVFREHIEELEAVVADMPLKYSGALEDVISRANEVLY